MSCPICTLNYTNIRRKKYACKSCQFECCVVCIVTYNKSADKEVDCMNCKKVIYFKNMQKVYLSAKDVYELENKYLKEYLFKQELNRINKTKLTLAIQNKKTELKNMLSKCSPELATVMKDIYEEKINNMSVDNFKLCSGSCSEYMYRDSDTKFFHCETCNLFACMNCEDTINSVDKVNSHECLVDMIQSLEIINKDTKPCPTCGVKIFKADGCSQVMCPECNTFFDFRTGLKEKDDEPRHARTYIDAVVDFEKNVISKERYTYFKSIQVIEHDLEFWDREEFKNIIHKSPTLRMWCAIFINIKGSVRKTLVDKINPYKHNEEIRIQFIKGQISERTFKQKILANYYYSKDLEFLCRELIEVYHKIKVAFNEMARELREEKAKTKKKPVYKLNRELADKFIDKAVIVMKENLCKFHKDKREATKNYNDMLQFVNELYINCPYGSRANFGRFRSINSAL